jgi:hypothetical protein
MAAAPPADDCFWLDVDTDGVDLMALLLPGAPAPCEAPPAGGELALQPPSVDEDMLRELEGALCAFVDAGGADARPLLRCLDGTHAPGCSRCRAAPSEGEESGYQLRALLDADAPGGDGGDGSTGGSSGIKRLRALLLSRDEWNSAEAREEAACGEDARGDPSRIAPLLRAKQSKALCKAHLLLLCRRWGYASDLWHRPNGVAHKRPRGAPKAAATTAAAAAAAAAAAPVPRPVTSVELLAVPVGGDASTLRTLWEPSARCFLGEACRVECVRVGVAFYNAAIDAEFVQFAAGSRAAAAQIATLACAQARWNDTVRTRLASDAVARGLPRAHAAGERIPALYVNSFSPNGMVPAEVAMHSFVAANATFHAAWRARRTSAVGVLAAVAPTLRLQPIDDEAEALYANSARFLTEALLLLMYVKARGSAEDYLATAVSVLDETARFVSSMQANMAAQRGWYAERLASGKLRPLEHDVTQHRFEEIWSGIVDKCEQTRSSADMCADNGSAAPLLGAGVAADGSDSA